jgi:hypothetical protein
MTTCKRNYKMKTHVVTSEDKLCLKYHSFNTPFVHRITHIHFHNTELFLSNSSICICVPFTNTYWVLEVIHLAIINVNK